MGKCSFSSSVLCFAPRGRSCLSHSKTETGSVVLLGLHPLIALRIMSKAFSWLWKWSGAKRKKEAWTSFICKSLKLVSRRCYILQHENLSSSPTTANSVNYSNPTWRWTVQKSLSYAFLASPVNCTPIKYQKVTHLHLHGYFNIISYLRWMNLFNYQWNFIWRATKKFFLLAEELVLNVHILWSDLWVVWNPITGRIL